ncbi:hypothetical protein [Olleya marilimosa]|jgi:hypothetical protein|uniref:hypothetical protein n=1 Tax=Olleya marilimosa TaxID=272164 RepID=UPI0004881A56|nr:hypothetical protein [Olleya marilimosa]|tara:strand:+ start:106 stop:744 length:639 start_codon:yes stop_codon:yes gene_type:complete
MNDLLKDCVEEVFTDENLNTLWLNRQSKQDIIGLETDLPIRYKLNDKGTRNIELMLQSQFGFYYKTIALVEDTNILFPRQFDALTNQIDFKGFKKYGMKSEINVMIGAFSMESLSYAIKSEDVDEYTTNGGKLEMVKAFDGTMQTFVKTEDSFAISSFSLTSGLYSSELDGEAVSSFNFTNGNSGVYPTNNTHQWLERLVPQRLMEIFTIEK